MAVRTKRGFVHQTLSDLATEVAKGRGLNELYTRRLQRLTGLLALWLQPGRQQSYVLTESSMNQLRRATADAPPDVRVAFGALIEKALSKRRVDGAGGPVLVMDEASQQALGTLAGFSWQTRRDVRGGLAATADVATDGRTRPERTAKLLRVADWETKGRKGLPRRSKTASASRTASPPPKTSQHLGRLQSQARTGASGSVLQETLAVLAPEIKERLGVVGRELLKDPAVQATLRQIVRQPSEVPALMRTLCGQAGGKMSTVLGCELVNSEVVARGLQLMPALGKRLGIDGVEECAKRMGKVLLKEGAEQALETGAKTGVRRGFMGLLSSVPLANVIPMLFTGAEVLTQFARPPPDRRVLGKGLATFALQLGAVAFPPLGVAAATVDMTGSVAIAVADAQKEGHSQEKVRQAGKAAIERAKGKENEMTEAIASNANVTGQALSVLQRTLGDLGATKFSDRAGELARQARELDPEDQAAARNLHGDIGRFAFDALLPEIIERVEAHRKGDEERSSESANAWQVMLDGLSEIAKSVMFVRRNPETQETDPSLNASKVDSLLAAVLRAGIAGTAIAGEKEFAARTQDTERLAA